MNNAIIKSHLVLLCMVVGNISFAQTTYTRSIYADPSTIPEKMATTVTGTWTKQNPNFNLGQIQSLFFIDEQTGRAVGIGNRLYKTSDGAKTWEKLVGPTYSSYIPNWSSVFFLDESTGWVSGGNIIHTTDGGQTWIKQDNGGFSGELSGSKLFFTDSENG